MRISTAPYRHSRRAFQIIFSLMVMLAVLITPLFTALPVHADWGADTRLSNAPDNSETPSIAVAGNSVHVAWQDMRDGNYEIYYTHSAGGGATWAADTRLSNAAGNSKSPSIAVSGNSIHVVWFDSRDGDEEIYYKRSTDGGANWGPDTRLTYAAGVSENPSIAVIGNVVHVVWFDERDGNPEIYYKRSIDGGTFWGADTRLTNAAGNSFTPAVAAAGNDVHVAWHDSRDGNEEIYYKRSNDGGTTWGADNRLSNAAGNSALASIAVYGNNVHVTWQDDRDGNWEIYYKRSTDSGASWGVDTRLTNAAGDSRYPSIAASGNNVHIAWQDIRGGNFQIYYNRSIDGGITWGADTRIVSSPRLSEFPTIAVSGNNVHLAWQDNREPYYPRWDIFYKKFSAVPVITSINPNHGIQGETHSYIINGANLTGATGVSFGDGITIKSFNVDSDSKISVNITILQGAATGLRNVSVITYQGTATHDFSVDPNPTAPHSAAMSAAPQGPTGLPSVSVQGASLSAVRVAPGEPVMVMANVANTGTVNGSSSVKVYVNGELENSQGVTVNSGSSTPVTFTVSRNDPGAYTVYVGGTNAGSFIVDEFAGPGIVICGAGLLFLIIFTAIIIVFRRNSQFSR